MRSGSVGRRSASGEHCPLGQIQTQGTDPTLESDITSERVFADFIVLRYPRAPRALVQRLGRSGWERFQRCAQSRLTESKTRNARTATQGQLENTEGKSSTIRDSGYGTEQRTISYAEAVVSYGRNDDFHGPNPATSQGNSIRMCKFPHPRL